MFLFETQEKPFKVVIIGVVKHPSDRNGTDGTFCDHNECRHLEGYLRVI